MCCFVDYANDRTMRLISISAMIVASSILFSAAPAHACLQSLFIQKFEAERIADNGYLVRAHVIRGYDAQKRQPELLQIDQVLIDTGYQKLPPVVELSHDNRFYDLRIKPAFLDCFPAFRQPSSDTLLLVLFPDDETQQNGTMRFRLEHDYTWVGWAFGKSERMGSPRRFFAPLVKAARQAGSLRAEPFP
jgi:hypothetical protein